MLNFITGLMKYPIALTIAGSDSSGGAGIQADIKTMSAIGVYAASVVTAITAQNTTGVSGIQGISPDMVAKQIDAVFTDLHPSTVKIGMLYSEEIIMAVAEKLRTYKPEYVILDPVMISTSGSRLISHEAIEAMKRELFPLSSVITPNRMEAEYLSGIKISDKANLEISAKNILSYGGLYVIVKGGHFKDTAMTDCLYDKNGLVECFKGNFVNTKNTHGTGCTFSSAIAAFLALGNDIVNAIRLAKQYLQNALECGADIDMGHGHGPVNHFFNPNKLRTI